MNRVIVNAKTGERTIVEMTQEEIDELITQQPPVDLDALKSERIADSKMALATYLESHPLTWADGKQYSVTAEKQSLLNNALAVYELAIAAGQPAELSWNATGEECTHWEYDALCALALAIAEYVKPLVSRQQAIEVAINAAQTAEEVNDVEISYS